MPSRQTGQVLPGQPPASRTRTEHVRRLQVRRSFVKLPLTVLVFLLYEPNLLVTVTTDT